MSETITDRTRTRALNQVTVATESYRVGKISEVEAWRVIEDAVNRARAGTVAVLRDLATEVEFAFPASIERRGLRQALDRAHAITDEH